MYLRTDLLVAMLDKVLLHTSLNFSTPLNLRTALNFSTPFSLSTLINLSADKLEHRQSCSSCLPET